MADEITLGFLKQAINNLSKVMQEQNKTNNIFIISNLLSTGIITLEEALNDENFKEFYNRLHTKNDENLEKPLIKAKINKKHFN